jgi:hypothetical protein
MNSTRDRLYGLLPAIHRLRDAERGYPLRDLLRVIAEQVNAVEDNITQLYDDSFIETASDWAVPYIADLVGYEPVHAAGDPIASRADENRILIPRREVANTIGYRRRRGTLSVLEQLANDVAGWPARAVEFYRLLGWTQNLNHQHADGQRARLVGLHDADALDRIGTPFDPFARTVDVRRIGSHRAQGRYNIPSVGVFVWRLQPYSVTKAPAYCLDAGKNYYTFSVLGNDAPLFTKPAPEPEPTHIAGELNVPARIRRRGFDADKESYYGEGKSCAVWAEWASHGLAEPVPASAIIAADLSDWRYAPPDDRIAVDPQLGRIAFPPNQLPRGHVRVTYHYGFGANIGGGEYDRRLTQPPAFALYTVGEHGVYRRITEALAEWRQDRPPHAVIEITDSGAYVEQINVALGENQSLQLRAANRVRPVLRLLDWQTDLPDALTVRMSPGSRFTLDGIMVTGRGVSIVGQRPPERRAAPVNRYENPRNPICPAQVVLRHCTLVPGWSLESDCRPASPNKESLELRNVRAKVTIESSIVGPIEVHEDEVQTDPIPIEIRDSVLDAVAGQREAIIGPSGRHAHAVLTVRRCTVFGIVQVHAMSLAENSIFNDCVHVARRQIGCMRFCVLPQGCRTPKRFNCQPDLVMRAAQARHEGHDPAAVKAAQARAAARVRPQFTSRRYGLPGYCQLSLACADEIVRGADDGSEMGVFHDLFQPQRLANLRARLEEYTPAGMNTGVVFAS